MRNISKTLYAKIFFLQFGTDIKNPPALLSNNVWKKKYHLTLPNLSQGQNGSDFDVTSENKIHPHIVPNGIYHNYLYHF